MNESNHPSPEALAAFVDGRLSGDPRAQVVAHLDRCRDCYEVFAETVRFQGAEEPRGRVVRSSRFGAPQWVWWTAAAAAVLVVAIAVPMIWDDPERPVGEGEVLLSSADLALALDAGGAGIAAAPWQGWAEGMGFAGGLDRETASFRAGVRLMDLAAAALAEEPAGASEALADLAGLLEAAGGAGELAGDLAAARLAVADGDALALARAVARLETGAEAALDPFHLAFGKWAEAGRLAAAAGEPELFRSPAFTGFQEELGARELPEPVAVAVARVEALTRAAPASPEETEDLARAFEVVLGRAG